MSLKPGAAVNADEAFDLLQELERNKSDEIRRQRQHFRLMLKARVTLLPGSASELMTFRVQGVTGDLSEGGCCALFPTPARVGDVYRLEFDRSVLDLPTTFARCVRCRLLREESYEAGFMFFSPICLPEQAHTADRAAAAGAR